MVNKALLVGSGGREDAIGRKLIQSSRLGKLYVAPGNVGTARYAENVRIKATDIDSLLAFALKERIEFTIVGQDDPLAMGIVDAFQAKGLRIFGPPPSRGADRVLKGVFQIPNARYWSAYSALRRIL